MGKTVKDVLAALDRAAPFSQAMEFDNVGLQTGEEEQPVTRVLIVLDITRAAVEEAAARGAELIVSHHPVIFHPLRAVRGDSPVAALVKNGVAAIACHTNLDVAEEIGVNRSLCRKLGLKNLRPGPGPLLLGETEVTTPAAFAQLVKERLNCPSVEYTPLERPVSSVAVCCGSGGEFIYECKGLCDLLLTGEARHDQLVYALDQGLPMVVAGHYATEKLFAEPLREYLQNCLPEVEFLLSQRETSPTAVL